MNELQEIFNNREIAVGTWIILAAIISIFTKPVRQFLKSVLPILFCRKFIVFYIAFLLHFFLVTHFLYTVGFWSMALLKDTIFWVLFVELPLFVKTIERAKNSHFFTKLILLLLNLPVVYGLALYNTYEQVFIRVKGNKAENLKMKWSIIGFAGIYLSKITAIRNNLQHTTAALIFLKTAAQNCNRNSPTSHGL